MSNDDVVTLTEKDGDKTVTLADLAGIDMSDVEAKRFFRAPMGTYVWEVCLDEVDNSPPGLKALNGKAAMIVPLKIVQVLGVKDPDFTGNPADLVGKVHKETQFLTSEESLKYIKAFLVDIGLTGKGSLAQILQGAVGLRFQAPVVHRPDKNDTSKVYVSLNQSKIVPAHKMNA